MSTAHKDFARGAFLFLAVQAAHRRNHTWANGALGLDRKNARDYLCGRLKSMAEGYVTVAVRDEDHVANVERLAEEMSASHAKALSGKRYRIGSAQKALNLYLKYLWCAGWIAEPPHCPFDNQVIRQLSNVPSGLRNWTTVDDISAYRCWVGEARNVAGDTSLAVWELGVWRPT